MAPDLAEVVGERVPALLVIDMQRAFTEAQPSLSAPALTAARRLVTAARSAGALTVFTVQTAPGGPFEEKLPTLARLVPGSEHCELAPELGPTLDAPIIEKKAPSAFFGTDLAGRLRDSGVEDVLVAGTSTSGCVRASVVDGMSLGFRMHVVEDAVFDRNALAGEVSLDDVRVKYGFVTDADAALEMLEKPHARE